MAAILRVVAMAQVTHSALGYLTRRYTENRRATTSSPAGWCSLLNGRHQSGTTIPDRGCAKTRVPRQVPKYQNRSDRLIEALLPIRRELALKVAAHCGSTEFSHSLDPGSPCHERHVQSIEHQSCGERGGHRPANDAAAEGVEHHREIEKTRPGRDIGDIRHPQPIRH